MAFFRGGGRTQLGKAMMVLLVAATASPAPAPPRLAIDPAGISISGISSGADFVVQFQVAFSSVVKGVGVFAGQPYHCAVTMFQGDPLVSPCYGTHHAGAPAGCTKATPSPDVPLCMNCPPGGNTLLYDHCKRYPHRVNVSALLSYAHEQASLGTIDGLGNLSGTNVYLYRGQRTRAT